MGIYNSVYKRDSKFCRLLHLASIRSPETAKRMVRKSPKPYLTFPNSQLPAGKVSLSIHSPRVASGSPTPPVSPATPPIQGIVSAETI